MNKTHTTLSVDDDLLNEAKQKGFNISHILEEALIEKVDKTLVEIPQFKQCDFCGNQDVVATAKHLSGVTWLWPHEKWICDRCLRNKSFEVIRGAGD